MPLLDFAKPQKLRSSEEHADMHSSDTGIAGTYVPNMSEEDQNRWKAKLINKGKDDARVEVKKTFNGVQVVIIVALDGWNYGSEKRDNRGWGGTTRGLNVRMSANGAIKATFEQFAEIQAAVAEARAALEASSAD